MAPLSIQPAVAIAAAGSVVALLLLHTVRQHRQHVRRPDRSSSAAGSSSSGGGETSQLEQDQPQRTLSPLPSVLQAIEEVDSMEPSPQSASRSGSPHPKRLSMSAMRLSATNPILVANRAFVRESATREVPVPLMMWIEYRLWVDRVISARAGRSENFHSFVYAHSLGLPNAHALKQHWSGEDAADLLACLAHYGLLCRDKRGEEPPPPPAAGLQVGVPSTPRALPTPIPRQEARACLTAWLERSLIAFDGIFTKARGRAYEGLSFEDEGQWGESYDFVQLADPQLGMLHADADWTEELTMLRLAIQHCNRLRPRFLLISGDLINAFPSPDLPDGGAVPARQVASFKEALHDLSPSIPLVLIPGNHDIGQVPTAGDIERYRERFGDDYFSFWVGGVLYVALNSQYYRDDDEVPALRAAQDEWAEKAFGEAKEHGAQHVVVLCHVPPFVSEEDEQAGWANWQHEHRKRIMRMAADANVKLFLCGHYHGNAVARSSSGIEVVTTSSCGGVINWTLSPSMIATQPFPDFKKVVGNPPIVADARHSGMRIVRVGEDRITHRWYELADVPATLDGCFVPASPMVNGKDRAADMAEVMGLTPGGSFKRQAAMGVVLPKRSQSICSPLESSAMRAARDSVLQRAAREQTGAAPSEASVLGKAASPPSSVTKGSSAPALSQKANSPRSLDSMMEE